MADEQYEPFGDEWAAQLTRFGKQDLIDLYRGAAQDKQKLEQELDEARKQLEWCKTSEAKSRERDLESQVRIKKLHDMLDSSIVAKDSELEKQDAEVERLKAAGKMPSYEAFTQAIDGCIGLCQGCPADPPGAYEQFAADGNTKVITLADDCWYAGMQQLKTELLNWHYDRGRRLTQPESGEPCTDGSHRWIFKDGSKKLNWCVECGKPAQLDAEPESDDRGACEDCAGTGWYGDNGPGIDNNHEYVRCHCDTPRMCRIGGHRYRMAGEGVPWCDKCNAEADMSICRIHHVLTKSGEGEVGDA